MSTPEPTAAEVYTSVEQTAVVPGSSSAATTIGDVNMFSSTVAVVGAEVEALTLLKVDGLPWLAELDVPAGWEIGRFDGEAPLSRIALCQARPGGGWDASETLAVFSVTGAVDPELIRAVSDGTLSALSADSINTYPLEIPDGASAAAMRSSGYLTVGHRRIWAQFSSYLASARPPAQGLLIEHAIFVDTAHRAALRLDVDDLTAEVHTAFLEQITTVDADQAHHNPIEGLSDGT
ncbi:hypothetical protein [Mycolicibacterium komossense]|uniref:Uncharacterized protein n=1 Tax=Mycolicibacterium komossense TaxID=1779 RepID=A0ABT3C5C6_9MYCO|nr:hypothetical protein [Mycolicibacterium komossense]MCV7224659.1 hypothetical protein [Mycolicibacterium komossense]